MSIPLVMLGPGGDYNTTLNVRGRGLDRQFGVQGTLSGQGHDPQGESAGGFAQWGRWRRKTRQEADNATRDDQPTRRTPGDRFDHVQGQAPTDVYTDRGTLRATPQRSVVIATAIQWLTAQQGALGRLAALITPFKPVTPRTHHASPRALAVTLPGPPAGPPYPTIPLPADRPEHTEANHEHEPHSQTTAHPHTDPRHPAGTRLFADHAGTRRRTQGLQGHRLRARRGLDQKGSAGQESQQGALFGG